MESCTATSKGPDGPVVEDAGALFVEESPLAVVDKDGSRCMKSDGSAFKAFLATAKECKLAYIINYKDR